MLHNGVVEIKGRRYPAPIANVGWLDEVLNRELALGCGEELRGVLADLSVERLATGGINWNHFIRSERPSILGSDWRPVGIA